MPQGRILDAEGHPTTDPRAFYGDAGGGPPVGTILPFGGDLGYRGFGLGLLVEVLGATIAGEPLGEAGDVRYINGVSLLAIDPGAVNGEAGRFAVLMEQLRDYITGSAPAPGSAGVELPGEREFRTRAQRLDDGIPLPEETVRQIRAVGARVGVTVDL